MFNWIYYCDRKATFSITPEFSVTLSFRNHANMLKYFLLLPMLKTVVLLYIFVLLYIYLFEMEGFCNIINIFNVAFCLFNTSWLNKSFT